MGMCSMSSTIGVLGGLVGYIVGGLVGHSYSLLTCQRHFLVQISRIYCFSYTEDWKIDDYSHIKWFNILGLFSHIQLVNTLVEHQLYLNFL